MALIERPSTPTESVRDRCSIESRGSREVERKNALDLTPQGSLTGARSTLTDARSSFIGAIRSWIARVRASVWAPVLARGAGVLVGMLGLATIGAIATARGVAGHPIAPAGSGVAGRRALEQSAVGASPRVPAPAPVQSAEGGPAEGKPPSAAVSEDGKVILNLATAEDLQRLPGIGRKRAETILALRAKLGGRFRRLSDLLRIRGIGPRRLKQLEPLLLLDPKEAPKSDPKEAPKENPKDSNGAAPKEPVDAGAPTTLARAPARK